MNDFSFFDFLWVRNRPVFDVAAVGAAGVTTYIVTDPAAGGLYVAENDVDLYVTEIGNPYTTEALGLAELNLTDEAGDLIYFSKTQGQGLGYTLVRFD